MSLHSLHQAPAGLMILVSNESRRHPPEACAEATARGLIQIDGNMPSDRLAQAALTRQLVVGELVGAFQEVKATSTREELQVLASGCTDRIAEIFKGTPWEMASTHPEIRAAIEEHILRNLSGAADLAVATE